MSAIDVETFRELLKTELPRLLREHPESRYELWGLMLEAFPSREETNRLLEELRALREDTERHFAEVDRRFEQVDQRFEQVDQRFESLESRVEAGFEEARREREAGFEEARREREAGFEAARREREAGFEAARREREAGFEAARREREAGFEAVRRDLRGEIQEMGRDLRGEIQEMGRDLRSEIQEVRLAVDRLGSRWGIRNESIFRQTVATLLEESFGAQVESRTIDGEEFDVIISDGAHILVEITASAGPKTQRNLERKRDLYSEATQVTPARVILVTASIHSQRAQALRDAGFEVIEPEEEALE